MAPIKMTILFKSKFYSKGIAESIDYVSAANLLINLPVFVYSEKNLIFLFIIVDNNLSKMVLAANKFPSAKLHDRQNARAIKIIVRSNKLIVNES